MEKWAYNYAEGAGLEFPKYESSNGRIPMKDLFDMLSGVSTGSIMSAGFSIAKPDDSPLYWAEDIKGVYINNAGEIFLTNSFGRFTTFMIYFLFIICFGSLFFFMGYYKYDNPKIHKA